MRVRFVYRDPKIYWRSAIIFSRSFDKVINTSRGEVAIQARLFTISSLLKQFLLHDIRPSRALHLRAG